MDACTDTHNRSAGRRARLRPDCSRGAVSRPVATPKTDHPGTAQPPTQDRLKVTIQVIPLPDYESNPLRARQLAVILDLLRSAASEAAERDAAPREHAQA